VVFEDHNSELITFGELFKGRPSIVVFFYTRCDNPLKCSLTITKLARIQKLLVERSLQSRINTAAITYDPEFDSPERIRGYGENRGLQVGPQHRLLRAQDGIEVIRKHFKLGVNFIESLVNRHRIEVYVLDAEGKIASGFQRIHWKEQEVVDAAIELLDENDGGQDPGSKIDNRRSAIGNAVALLATIGVAFFPKCPICWAAYLSVFGIAGLDQIPYSPSLQPILATVMLINLGSVWLRARATGRMLAFYFASAGALAIICSKFSEALKAVALFGVILTLTGSMLSAFSKRQREVTDSHKSTQKNTDLTIELNC
jgi:protein SCO1/2